MGSEHTTARIYQALVATGGDEYFHILNLCRLANFSCFCCHLLTFFKKNNKVKKIDIQTVWIHIRMDILSVLIWVQSVGNIYKQITKVATSKERFMFDKTIKYLPANSLNMQIP